MMHDETTDSSDHDVTRRAGETSLEWLARIAPDDWAATEDGYGLCVQSGRGEGDRRVVIDPLDNRATFEERVETEAFGERWHHCETVEGPWYLQTTAGLLLWGIGDDTDTDTAIEDTDAEATEKCDRPDRIERTSTGER